jgi:hypothetical protein
MARDLIEHEGVYHVSPQGEVGKAVRWQGGRVKVGSGRKVDEAKWIKLRDSSRKWREHEGYAMSAAGYREVDYRTGRRVLLRKPVSGEVVLPKGIEVTTWTWF